MTFPILASLLVRLVVLLPFQLLRLSLATPSRWTPLAITGVVEDRKSGSAGMPRPISYAVFCLKKKNTLVIVSEKCEYIHAPVYSNYPISLSSHSLSPSITFFLIIRHPPRSTLFPTRRSSDLMTFPILASLLVRLVVLLPFQLLRLSLATPSRWTPLAITGVV